MAKVKVSEIQFKAAILCKSLKSLCTYVDENYLLSPDDGDNLINKLDSGLRECYKIGKQILNNELSDYIESL